MIYNYDYGLPYWAIFWLLAAAALWLFVVIWLRSDRRSKSVQKTTILTIHADEQHAAIMAGDDHTGIYGRYPPYI